MKLKQTLIALFALIAVMVLISVLKQISNKEPNPDKIKFLAKYNRAETGKITMIQDKDTAVIRLAGDRWVVAREKNYPADTAKVNIVLEKMGKLNKSRLQATNPETQKDLEVDSAKGLRVIVEDKAGALVGDFYIGKNGADYSSQYIRMKSDNKIYCSDESIRWDFITRKNQWRDNNICSIDRTKITSIEMNYLQEIKKETPEKDKNKNKKKNKPEEPPKIEYKPYYLKLVQDDSLRWKAVSENNQPVDKEKMDNFLNNFSPLKTDEWCEDTTQRTAAFDTVHYTVKLALSGGNEVIFTAGKAKDNKYCAKINNQPEILFELYKYRVDNLMKKFDELKAVEKPKEEKQDSAAAPEPSGKK